MFVNNYEVSMGVHAFLSTFNKIFFISGIGWILHLTFLGKLRFIYSILSFKNFTPLARITYGTYLIHFNIEYAVILSLPALLYFEFWSLFFLSVGFFFISYVLSFFLSILIESPIIAIQKKFMGGSE